MLLCFILATSLCDLPRRKRSRVGELAGVVILEGCGKGSHYKRGTKNGIINGKYVQMWIQTHPITCNLREMMCAKLRSSTSPAPPPPVFKYELRFTQLNTLVTHWLRFLEKKCRLTTARDRTVRSCLTFYSGARWVWSCMCHHCAVTTLQI